MALQRAQAMVANDSRGSEYAFERYQDEELAHADYLDSPLTEWFGADSLDGTLPPAPAYRRRVPHDW